MGHTVHKNTQIKFALILKIFVMSLGLNQNSSPSALVIIDIHKMEAVTDEVLAVKVEKLKNIEDYYEECETCRKPNLIHAGPCTRSELVEGDRLI